VGSNWDELAFNLKNVGFICAKVYHPQLMSFPP
jgi:hypothetical protein